MSREQHTEVTILALAFKESNMELFVANLKDFVEKLVDWLWEFYRKTLRFEEVIGFASRFVNN